MKKILLLIFTTFSLFLVTFVAAAQSSLTRNERAEVRFLEGMIDHHQMALDMAEDCLQKATTDSVITVCTGVIEAQTAEIERMQSWLLDWYNIAYEPLSMMAMDNMDAHGGHNMMNDNSPFTDPPMMMGMFAGFNRLEGADYEIAWLESMVDHHDDALHMAERILSRVVHPELGELAEQIITDQTAEIELMENIIIEFAG